MRARMIRVAVVVAALALMGGAAASALAATPISPGASATPLTTAPQGLPKSSAEATPTATEAPLVEGDVGVQLGVDTGQSAVVAIVGVTLGHSAPLPARVRVPVPANSAIVWAGEILGGDPGADPQKEYKLVAGEGGGQYAEFTLTGSHQGQIECNVGAIPVGQSVSAKASFVQSVPSKSTSFSVRLPSGAGDVRIQPAPVSTPEFNAAGESLYTLETKAMPVGSKFDVSFSYTKGSPAAGGPAPSATPQSGQSSSALLIALLAGSAIVFLVAAVVIARQSGEASESDNGLLIDDEDGALEGEGEDASVELSEADELDAGDGAEPPAELDESDDPFSDADES